MKTLVEQYLETALWSSIDENEEPYDINYSIDDFSEEAIKQATKDCDDFFDLAGDLVADIEMSDIGHDFWLTRNRHGAGFWDRGLGEIGEKLTDIAHSFGSSDVYLGDDGKLHLS